MFCIQDANLWSSQQSDDVAIIIINHVLEMRKLRLSHFLQGSPAHTWWNWNSNPGVSEALPLWAVSTRSTLLTPNVWGLFSSHQPIFQSPSRHLCVPQFNSDTNCPVVAQIPQVKGSVPQDDCHFRHWPQVQVSCTSDQQAINQGFPQPPIPA